MTIMESIDEGADGIDAGESRNRNAGGPEFNSQRVHRYTKGLTVTGYSKLKLAHIQHAIAVDRADRARDHAAALVEFCREGCEPDWRGVRSALTEVAGGRFTATLAMLDVPDMDMRVGRRVYLEGYRQHVYDYRMRELVRSMNLLRGYEPDGEGDWEPEPEVARVDEDDRRGVI